MTNEIEILLDDDAEIIVGSPFIDDKVFLNQFLFNDWYSGKDSMHKCIDENPNCVMYVQCHTDEGRKFKNIRNRNYFFENYNQCVPEFRSFYEICTLDMNVPLLFDIDGLRSDKEFIGKTDYEIVSHFINTVENYFRKEYPTHFFGWRWYCMSSCATVENPSKKYGSEYVSFRVIGRGNYKFRNTKELAVSFIPDIYDYCIEHNCKFDKVPYTSYQQYRILGSTKFGENRPFVKMTYTDGPDELFLISYVELGCNFLLPENPELSEQIKLPEIEYVDNGDDDLAFILEILKYISPDGKCRWFQTGTKLKCINPDYINIFIQWSRNSYNFDEYECKHFWKTWKINMKPDNATGGLVNLAKECNPNDYQKAYCKKKVQNSFPLSEEHTKFLEIIKIRKDRRTDEQSKFIKEFYDKKSDETIDQLNYLKTGIDKDDEWVNIDKNENSRYLLIKAPLGKGKSYSARRHINEIKYTGIIYLCPRQHYATSVTIELNKDTDYKFKNYLNCKKQLITEKFIVIQAESLYRLDYYADISNFLIVADEVESFLTQLTSSETNGNNHDENVIKFQWLILNAKKVICYDALLTSRTTDTFDILNLQYTIHNYIRPAEIRNYILEPNLANRIICDISSGKKGWFICQSKNKMLNEFKVLFDKFLPHKKILYYYAGNTPVSLKNIDKWNRYDLIVSTTAITVGVNYDIKGVFDRLYYYTNDFCGLVRDGIQGLHRIRHINDKLLYVCIDERDYVNLPTSLKEIKHINEFKDKIKIEQYNLFTGEIHKESLKWYVALKNHNLFEMNVSTKFVSKLFKSYMNICSYTEIKNDSIIITTEEEFDDVPVDKKYKYDDIPVLTYVDVQKLKKKQLERKDLTQLELLSIDKFYYNSNICDNSEPNAKFFWRFYQPYNKDKFYNLTYEKGLKQGKFKLKDIVEYNNIDIALCSDYTTKLELISYITTILELESSWQTETIISHNQVEKLGVFFMDNLKIIYNFFPSYKTKFKQITHKNIRGILNAILRDFSSTKIVKISDKTSGSGKDSKHIYTYTLKYGSQISYNSEKFGDAVTDFDISDEIKTRDGFKTKYDREIEKEELEVSRIKFRYEY